MGSLHETNRSLWIATAPDEDRFPPVAPGLIVDIAVVGAGIAGTTLARLLAEDGASVALLDSGAVCSGVTANTTAKVTALQRTVLSDIEHRHDEDVAAIYAAANLAAVERVAVLAQDIDCDLERAPACTYTLLPEHEAEVQAEFEAAQRAGLPVRLGQPPDLPFPVHAAVLLDDQVAFHPRKYCLGLADAVVRLGGTVAERTRVLSVDSGSDGVTLETTEGSVHASHAVLATHLPIDDTGGFFARAHPRRSYAMAVRVSGERPRTMAISVEEPTRSLRSTTDGWVIAGGEGHRVGHGDSTAQCYANLEAWAREVFDVTEIGPRWSAQDYESVDGLPFVGTLTPAHPRVWVATGFRKWGMTNATVAAMVLRDRIAGRDNPWAATFDASRLPLGASIKSLVTENLEAGKRMIGDRIRRLIARDASELAPGEGDVVKLDGATVAAFRDDDGTLHAVDPTCTHIGCRVAFNDAERSWDCPCHGSRFTVDGEVLQGPAVRDLERKA